MREGEKGGKRNQGMRQQRAQGAYSGSPAEDTCWPGEDYDMKEFKTQSPQNQLWNPEPLGKAASSVFSNSLHP